MTTVWILTSKYNDYDQHGEYFEDVFAEKPTVQKIKELCCVSEDYARHILNGGGREKYEDIWYYLNEYQLIAKSGITS